MTRFLAMLLCLSIFALPALAEPKQSDIEDFAVYAEVYGFEDLKISDADIRTINNGRIAFAASWRFDSCRIVLTFDSLCNVNGAMIDGSGDPFLNACATYVTYYDRPNFTTNLGAFLFSYLMVQQKENDENELGTFADGTAYHITKKPTYYSFLVVR